jgi:hypothetical protein
VTALSTGFSATAQDYAEGWYQIKRTVNMGTLADTDLSSMTAVAKISSLLTDVSYLNTTEEFTTAVTIPIVNISAGTAVYGAHLLDVDGSKDYSADLLSSNGRNTNEKEISTYYYITPVGTDDDGTWRYTVRSLNGHYMGTDGRYYANPQEVYFNSSIGFSLGDTMDKVLNSMLSSLGVGIGSKQYTLSTEFIDNIPYIDKLSVYETLKPLVDALGEMGVKISENSWAKITDTTTDDSGEELSESYIGAEHILAKLTNIAQESEQFMQYYNDNDYAGMGKLLMKYVNFDLFKLKKIDLSNVTISSSLLSYKHAKVIPYTVNLIGFGDNFSLTATDYSSADSVTKLSQKTNQNVQINYTGEEAQENALTTVYSGGTLFLQENGTLSEEQLELNTDNSSSLIDLSHEQHATLINNDTHEANIVISSQKQYEIFGWSTGRWSDNYKTVTINANGYTTFYSPFEVSIPTAEKTILGTIRKNAPNVYVIKKISDDNLICFEILERIPANTPVLIKGDAEQTYDFTVINAGEDIAEAIDENVLTGALTTAALPSSTYAYCITTDANEAVQFVPIDAENRTVNAWEAYLATTGDEISAYSLLFDGDTSALGNLVANPNTEAATLEAVNQLPATTAIYDISGRRLTPGTLTPGIYIINGWKTSLR